MTKLCKYVIISCIRNGGIYEQIRKRSKSTRYRYRAIKKQLESIGALLKNEGIQRIYVYDLPSIYARFYDCMMQLNQCSKSYDIDICKSKLRTLFMEIDNLMSVEQQESTQESIGYRHLTDTLSICNASKLKAFCLHQK